MQAIARTKPLSLLQCFSGWVTGCLCAILGRKSVLNSRLFVPKNVIISNYSLGKVYFALELIYNTTLKRKIESVLVEWKTSGSKKPLVIKGIRQCGKTYIVQKYAKENYESVIYMN